MTISQDTHAQGKTVVFADSARLYPHIDALLAERDAIYAVAKSACADRSIERARMHEGSCIAPLTMPRAGLFTHQGQKTISFSDGLTRSAALVRAGAKFVPLQVFSHEARAIHMLVGTDRPPEPASSFIIPLKKRHAKNPISEDPASPKLVLIS